MIRSIMRPRITLSILVHTFQQHLINYLTIGKYFICCSIPTHLPQVLYNSKIPGLFRHEWLVEAIAVLASGDQMVAFLPTWGASAEEHFVKTLQNLPWTTSEVSRHCCFGSTRRRVPQHQGYDLSHGQIWRCGRSTGRGA